MPDGCATLCGFDTIQGRPRAIFSLLTTTLVAFVISHAPTHHHTHHAHHHKTHHAICSNANPRACVEYVIVRKHIGEPERSWLRQIPACESEWKPLAVNPGKIAYTASERREAIDNDDSSGLFQFKPTTWAGTPYARRSIWSAKWQAFAANFVYQRDGGGSEWVCKG